MSNIRRCTSADCGRVGSQLVWVEEAEPPDWFDYCEQCAATLKGEDVPCPNIERSYSLDVCCLCGAVARDAITEARCEYHPDAALERIKVVPASQLRGAVSRTDALAFLRTHGHAPAAADLEAYLDGGMQ